MTTPASTTPVHSATREELREAPYVLMKRGLYERPNRQGYTGVLDEAGRYGEVEARAHADHYGEDHIKLESEADRFSPACWEPTKLLVLAADHADLQAQLAEMERERDEARRLHRWNFDRDDSGVLVCRGEHDKGDCCEYERLVPVERYDAATARAEAAKAEIGRLKAENERLKAERSQHLRWLGLSEGMTPGEQQEAAINHEFVARFLDEQRAALATQEAGDAPG